MLSLIVALALLTPPAAAQKIPKTLSMREGDDLDAFFDGAKPRKTAPFNVQLPDAEVPPPAVIGTPVAEGTPPPDSRAERVLNFTRRFLALEGSAAIGGRSNEIEPRLRVDVANILDALPNLPGKRNLAVDVEMVDLGIVAGMLAVYAAGKALDFPYWQGGWQRFSDNFEKNGLIGTASIEFKDPNYGDPWVNELSHPMMFQAAGTYFRKRGYGFWKSMLGGNLINLSWEYIFEAYEQPKSGHDIFFMNFLGVLAGAHPDLGIAWGVSPLRFADSRGHYTEFYYRPSGTPWRVFFRLEPNGDYQHGPGPKTDKKDRPLFVDDFSIGAAREDWGLTAFITGVTDTKAREFSDVNGVDDVFNDVRVGLSYDALRLLSGR